MLLISAPFLKSQMEMDEEPSVTPASQVPFSEKKTHFMGDLRSNVAAELPVLTSKILI